MSEADNGFNINRFFPQLMQRYTGIERRNESQVEISGFFKDMNHAYTCRNYKNGN